MPLLPILIQLIVVGVLLWLVNTVIPMPAWVRTTINVVAGLIVVLWLLQMFGVLGPLGSIRVR